LFFFHPTASGSSPHGSLRGKVGWGSKIREAIQKYEADPTPEPPKLLDVINAANDADRNLKDQRRKKNPTNIWNEVGLLKFEAREKTVAAHQAKALTGKTGNLNHLVTWMTRPLDGEPTIEDAEFMRRVFVSLDSFTTPEVFVEKLIERYMGPDKDNISEYEKNVLANVQKRVCTVLYVGAHSSF